MRIYLETQAKLYIQQLIIEKKLKLVCSFILRYENSENPNISNRDSIAQFFVNASEYVGNENIEDIRKMADDFIKQGIEMKDATHLACAIKAGCDYFLTTDDKLTRRYNGKAIKVRTPLTFLKDMEEETNA
jgi:predicted nucleic acid-binding protein